MPATDSSARGATIIGWGSYLPPKVLTNHDLERMVDTSDEWIVERSGIRERHVDGTTIGMSIEAGRAAIQSSGLSPADIDALIIA
ncbi:MAG: 3-oxoacyl-ACP synthase, partial [Ilumatobacteraceae bacterium]